MKIIVDHRERKSLVIEELEDLGVTCEIKHLPLADYLISKDVAVERKTVSDFVSSMINKRLIRQLTDMKLHFKKPILLVEGVAEEDIYHPSSHPRINENAIRGMLLSTALDLEVPIIFTDDAEDTAKYLQLLLKRQGKPDKVYGLSVKRKAHSLKDQQQILVESFPGVGPNLAKSLLKYFKSIKSLFEADIKSLIKVEKVGKKKAALIKKIIDSRY